MKQNGQSMLEYGLIAMLVGVVVVAPLSLLGQNCSSFLHSMLKSKPDTQTVANASNPSASPTIPSTTPISQGPSLNIGLANGSQLVISNYPKDINQSLATTGANGTTAMLLGNMDSVIEQLIASGSVAPEEANLLQQLANQGHQLGEIESLIEMAMNNSGSTSNFESQQITYQGKSYTPKELADLIGADDPKKLDQFINTGLGTVTVNNSTFTAGPEAIQFFDLLNRVNQLNLDPAARETINILSKQIGYVANGVQSGVNYIANFDTPLSEFTDLAIYWSSEEDLMPSVQDSLNAMPSAITHSNSAEICNVGNGTDTGQQCN